MSGLTKQSIRALLAFSVLVGCIGCDQATKQIASRTLRNSPPQSFFADTVRLYYVQNSGGVLSLGSTFPPRVRFWFFTVVNTAFLAAVVYVLLRHWSMHVAQFVALLFLLAGGIGNLIDRITNNGLVTDFLNVGIGPIRTGIFNVADMAVLFSAIALFFVYREKASGHSTDAQSDLSSDTHR